MQSSINEKIQPKIRIVHYCNQLSLGGTERTMELFCQFLSKEKYEVFAVSKYFQPGVAAWFRVKFGLLYGHKLARAKNKLWKSMNARIPSFQHILGVDHVFLARNDEEVKRILMELKPTILHVHYSGRSEPPTSDEALMSTIPVTVTTNQFEIENTATAHRHVKKIFFVSKWMLQNQAPWAKSDPRVEVFYNPTEPPLSTETLRQELHIPGDAFVIGRVGRADPGIHDPISLRAYKEMQDERTYFIALSPPQNMVLEADELKLKNFITLPFTSDPMRLSKFYNSIDVLAHARKDGETFGCNLAEAMIHGKPCVSHLTDAMNAQTETIGGGGFVTEKNDWKSYAGHLKSLRDNKTLYDEKSKAALTRALEEFEVRKLVKKLECIYDALIETETVRFR